MRTLQEIAAYAFRMACLDDMHTIADICDTDLRRAFEMNCKLSATLERVEHAFINHHDPCVARQMAVISRYYTSTCRTHEDWQYELSLL